MGRHVAETGAERAAGVASGRAGLLWRYAAGRDRLADRGVRMKTWQQAQDIVERQDVGIVRRMAREVEPLIPLDQHPLAFLVRWLRARRPW